MSSFGRRRDGTQTVGFMDPVAVMQMTNDPEVAKVAAEVRSRLERVRSSLSNAASAAQTTTEARPSAMT